MSRKYNKRKNDARNRWVGPKEKREQDAREELAISVAAAALMSAQAIREVAKERAK